MTTAIENMAFRKTPEPCLQEEAPLFKNAFCPYYSECLHRAVKARWQQFTCRNCSWRNIQLAVRPEPREMEGYYRLLGNIFSPGRSVS
jgi:hypothetical protein